MHRHHKEKDPLEEIGKDVQRLKIRYADAERRVRLINQGLDPDEVYPTVHDFGPD